MGIITAPGKVEYSMSRRPSQFGDYIRPFQIEDLGLNGRLVRLGDVLDQAFARHQYPDEIANLLGQTMALAATLSGAIKYDGVFTLQVQGDGPVSPLMVDLTSGGDIRGYVRFDTDKLAKARVRGGAIVPKLLGAGHMAFTVDQGPDTERYQGIVGLEGENLADCAQNYFQQSEQLETAIVVAADTTSLPGSRSAALMIQRLPSSQAGTYIRDEEDDAWRRAVVLMSSVTQRELLDPDLSDNALLYRLYHEDGVRVFDSKPILHQCRCSETRVKRTLASFPKEEISELADDGIVSVTCEFCKMVYRFPVGEAHAD